MGYLAPTLNTATRDDAPIGRWSLAFLILLPFLVLGSRVSADAIASASTLFLAGFWFMRPASQGGIAIRQQTWFKVFLVLWLFMCATAFFAVDPQYVFEQALISIRWPAYAVVLSCLVLTSETRLQIFERSALIFFVFIALDSIFQYFYGQDIFGHVSGDAHRLTGPFTKLVPGSYGLRIYPMALVALLTYGRHLPKLKFVSLVVAMVALSQFYTFLAGERVVFVLFGLVNAALLITLIYQEKLSYRFVLTALSGFVVLAAVSVTVAHKMFERTIVSLFYQLGHFQDGTSYPIYVTAYHLWQKTPWIGVGTRYFYQSCEALPVADQPMAQLGGCVVHPHQIYVEWITQNGVIGLALFLIVLYFIFRTLWRNLDFKTNLLQSTVVFIALVMLFFPITPSMSIQTNNYAGVAWLLVAWALARALLKRRERQAAASAQMTQT